jgi:hypothetical protein
MVSAPFLKQLIIQCWHRLARQSSHRHGRSGSCGVGLASASLRRQSESRPCWPAGACRLLCGLLWQCAVVVEGIEAHWQCRQSLIEQPRCLCRSLPGRAAKHMLTPCTDAKTGGRKPGAWPPPFRRRRHAAAAAPALQLAATVAAPAPRLPCLPPAAAAAVAVQLIMAKRRRHRSSGGGGGRSSSTSGGAP